MFELIKRFIDQYHERRLAEINLSCKHSWEILESEKSEVFEFGKKIGTVTTHTLQCSNCGDVKQRTIDNTANKMI